MSGTPSTGKTISRSRSWPIGVRQGRPEDRDQIIAMVAAVFEGHDYIPDVIDEWLVPGEGVVLVATVAGPGAPAPEGHVVAMTRVTLLSPTEAWLEGIRVDPVVRGMDVATDLQVAELHWIAAHGARVVRYLTADTNVGSLHLGARHGLVEIGRWRFRGPGGQYEQPPVRTMDEIRAALGQLRPATAEDWASVAADPLFIAAHGLYEYRGWAFQELTRQRFLAHVGRGEAFALPGRGRASSSLAIINAAALAEGRLHIAFVAGEGRPILELLERLGHPGVRLPEPLPDSLTEVGPGLSAAGYVPWRHAAVVVERPLDDRHPLPPIDPAALRLLETPRPIARATDPSGDRLI